jgi:transposase-like protein
MMAERGTSVDHSTVHRSAIKLLPVLEKEFRRSKRKVGKSWRMDETYIKVKGEWKYLHRAIDKAGDTVDFLLRAHRDRPRHAGSSEQAIERNGTPRKVTIDKSGSNGAALEAMNAGRGKRIVVQ